MLGGVPKDLLIKDMLSGFRAAFDTMPCPAVILDCGLSVVACNGAYERLAHVKEAAMIGRNMLEIFPGSDDQQAMMLKASYDRVLLSREPHHIPHLQYDIGAPDDSGLQEHHWAISNLPLKLDDGTLFGILHCPSGITELTLLRQANQTIQASDHSNITHEDIQRWTRSVVDLLQSEKERLRQLFQQAPSFIAVAHGPEHIFELANDAYYQLVGHREIIGRRVADVMPEVVAQGFLDKLDAVYSTGVPFIGHALPIGLQRVAGGPLELNYIDLIYQPIFDDTGKVTGIFAQGNNVTQAHTLAQEFEYQAAHDSLTGLYNRREFSKRAQMGAGPGTHALLYMDLDQFKIVNDRCGHEAGDMLLIDVTGALQGRCQSGDFLVRLGGDEFALARLILDACQLGPRSWFRGLAPGF